MEGPLSVPGFYFVYNIWQDAGYRTRVAATATFCFVFDGEAWEFFLNIWNELDFLWFLQSNNLKLSKVVLQTKII